MFSRQGSTAVRCWAINVTLCSAAHNEDTLLPRFERRAPSKVKPALSSPARYWSSQQSSRRSNRDPRTARDISFANKAEQMAPRVVRVCLVPSIRNRPTETQRPDAAVVWFLSVAFASAKHLRADFFVNHLGSHRSARRRNSTVTRHYDTPFSPPIEPPRRSLACENQHFTSTNSSSNLR